MNVVLVCRRWRTLGEDPSLWSDFVVTYTRQHVPEMLSIRRLQKVQHINIRCKDSFNKQEADKFFSFLENLKHLKQLTGLSGFNYMSVEPEMFGKVLSRLTDIDINNTRVTDMQLEELCRMMPITGKVKRLGMQALNISSVYSDLFASAVQELEYLNIGVTTHTNEQIRAVFDKWAEKCALKEVKMSQANFSSVEPEVFGKVLSCIEK